MPPYTKRIACSERQAPPHRPAEPLHCRGISNPLALPLALPGLSYLNMPTPRTAQSPPYEPLRLAKPEIHRHSWSPPGHALRPAQACMISFSLGRTHQACHTRDTHMHDLHSAGLPQGLSSQGSLHRQAGSLLCGPVPFRHSRPTLQKPTSSPQLKASTHRLMGSHPPATCHRKSPNLPKRHTQVWMLKN
jgi:hypothetical protein